MAVSELAKERLDRLGYPEALIDEQHTEEDRYGIYVLEDGQPVRIAEASKDAIGTALVQLADDRRDLEGENRAIIVGVLDQIERRWITGLWP